MTANQLEYMKELRRIKQAVRRAEKRGYRFVEEVVPQTPKRITKKAIQSLKEITPPKIYAKAQYLDEHTGKVVSGQEGRKLEAQARGRKAQETRNKKNTPKGKFYPNGGEIIADNVIDDFISKFQSSDSSDVDNLINEMQQPEPPFIPFTRKIASELELAQEERKRSKLTILNLTYSVMGKIGKEALGWRLQERSAEVDDCINEIVYKGSRAEAIQSACMLLASIIKGAELTMAEMQDLGEQEEFNEGFEPPL